MSNLTRRHVDGILLLDKPAGMTSNGALQQVKRLYQAQKAGHTGSLDPMATGVLPICLGEATKFSQYLLNADKIYAATIRFGELTSTGDAEGEVLHCTDASFLTEAMVSAVLPDFFGDITQVPPMVSALKVGGVPLYKLARQGITVARDARHVRIIALELHDFRAGTMPEADIVVECSKGTYIRSLAEDIGAALGVGAHLSALRRLKVGQFLLQDCITLPALALLAPAPTDNVDDLPCWNALDDLLIPAEDAACAFPLLEVPETTGYYVRLGQAVFVPKAPIEGWVRLVEVGEHGRVFLGVGEVLDDGRIAPRRLIASS